MKQFSIHYSICDDAKRGLATMDILELSQPTLLFMSILMFIGASPSSVGADTYNDICC